MSGSYDRSRSPNNRRSDDRYNNSRNDRDRRDRRYDDYNRSSGSRRNDRDDYNSRRRNDYDRSDRHQPTTNKQEVPEEDIKMTSRDSPPPASTKKRVPISIEELLQKKEQEKKDAEKVSVCIVLLAR